MSPTLIVHSHHPDIHWEAGPEYRARLSKGLEFLTQNKASQILLTGGYADTNNPTLHYARVWEKWLESQWADMRKVAREGDIGRSRESIGELVFARIEQNSGLLSHEHNIILLSSDYHIKRLWEIAKQIFGMREISYHGVAGFHRSEELEISSLEAFRTTFAGIPIGDLQAIEERLWESHWLYKDHPNNPNNTTA